MTPRAPHDAELEVAIHERTLRAIMSGDLDRIEAAMATADGLLRRLTEGRRSGRPTKLISLLAERVYLLERALEGLDSGEAADAHIRINPAAGVEAEDDARAFVRDLGEMYVAWASRRGMRIEPVEANGVSRSYAVSGIAAYTILRPETGLHVLELPERHRSYSRVGAHVTVTPAPWDGASAADGAGRGSRAVVRRYRRDPSPLVRDSVRGWRTGRLDRVLGGEFDVLI
jgi:ATP-dependent Clp protease ATP-binding subunit ClpC